MTALSLHPRMVIRISVTVILLLMLGNVAAHVLLRASPVHLSSGAVVELSRRFVVDSELNIPTWYQSSTLFVSAQLLAIIAAAARLQKAPGALQWGILSFIFLCLSIDEAASVHEILIVPLRRVFNTGGLFYFAWIVPAIIGMGVFVASYARFYLALPRRTRLRAGVAAALYVAGAIGMEMVGGLMAEQSNFAGHFAEQAGVTLSYVVAATLEELLEMTGVAVLLYTLVDYLCAQNIVLNVVDRSQRHSIHVASQRLAV